MFPEDETINHLYSDFKERQARELINKKIEERKGQDVSFTQTPIIDEFEEKLSNTLLEACKNICKKFPNLAYDFGIMFTFLDMSSKALEILKINPPRAPCS